jgi:hypothetical protein
MTVVVALVALLGGAGCASSQMNRIDRNRDLYETWPLEVRQSVLDGKVEPGMNSDMVRVAWGEPTEVNTSQSGDEIWVYSKGGDPGGMAYPGGMGMGGSGIGLGGTGSGIGISTGRGGTVVGTTTGIGLGGSMGGIGLGGGMGGVGLGGGMGGMGIGGGGLGGPMTTRPTPPDIREVVFRNGIVVRADSPK